MSSSQVFPAFSKRGELPKRVDKDPKWRASAIFTREELEQLISDVRVHPDRRVLYGLLGLAGLRIGEAAARALGTGAYARRMEALGMAGHDAGEPTSDDLIVPSRRSSHRARNHALTKFHQA